MTTQKMVDNIMTKALRTANTSLLAAKVKMATESPAKMLKKHRDRVRKKRILEAMDKAAKLINQELGHLDCPFMIVAETKNDEFTVNFLIQTNACEEYKAGMIARLYTSIASKK